MTYLTPRETGTVLKVSLSTLRHWRMEKIGPPVTELSPGTFRYSDEALKRWLEERTRQ